MSSRVIRNTSNACWLSNYIFICWFLLYLCTSTSTRSLFRCLLKHWLLKHWMSLSEVRKTWSLFFTLWQDWKDWISWTHVLPKSRIPLVQDGIYWFGGARSRSLFVNWFKNVIYFAVVSAWNGIIFNWFHILFNWLWPSVEHGLPEQGGVRGELEVVDVEVGAV